jgi:hypothetical protein
LILPTFTDSYLFFAFWTGIAALALTLLLGGEIVWLRMALRRQQRRNDAVVLTWRPIIAASVADAMPRKLPRLRGEDRIAFLKLWVHLHVLLRGSASAGLNALGQRMHADAMALQLIRRGNRGQRLLGIITLGYLRDARHFDEVKAIVAERDSVISLYAAWALVQADPYRAAAELVQPSVERKDWGLPQVVVILQEGGAAMAAAFVERLPQLGRAELVRGLRIAEGCRVQVPAALLDGMLQQEDQEIQVAALRLVSDPGLLPRVRKLCHHEEWRIRVNAAKCLGRIGAREDVELLKVLLSDRQWWVRHRAAEALAALPFLERGYLEALADATPDPFAAKMLRQVLAPGAAA